MDPFGSPTSPPSSSRDAEDVADLERFQMKSLDDSGGRYDDDDDDGGMNAALTAQADHIKARYNVDLVKAGVVPQKSPTNNVKNNSSSPIRQVPKRKNDGEAKPSNSDFSWDGVKIGGAKGKLVPPFVGGGSNPSSMNNLVKGGGGQRSSNLRPPINKTTVVMLGDNEEGEEEGEGGHGSPRERRMKATEQYDQGQAGDSDGKKASSQEALPRSSIINKQAASSARLTSNVPSTSSALASRKRGIATKTTLESKDAEIERLENAISSLSNGSAETTSADGGGGGAGNAALSLDARDAKIVELVKRSKQLTLQLNRERDRVAKLTVDLASAQAANSAYEASGGGVLQKPIKGKKSNQNQRNNGTNMEDDDRSDDTGNGGGNISALQQMEERAKALSIQLQKQQRTNERALAELRATHRILLKELGPLQSHPMSSSSSSLAMRDANALTEQQSATILLARALHAHGIQHSVILGDTKEASGGGSDGPPPPLEIGGGSSAASVMSAGAASSSSSTQSSSAAVFIPGDWKGRQQTITLLRTKVKALERELIKRSSSITSASVGGGAELALFTPSQPSLGPSFTPAVSSSSISPKSLSQLQPSFASDGAPSDSAFGLGLDNTNATEYDDVGSDIDREGRGDIIIQRPMKGLLEDGSSFSASKDNKGSSATTASFTNNGSPTGSGKMSSGVPPPPTLGVISSSSRNSHANVPNALHPAANATGFDVDDRAVAVIAARESSKAAQVSRLNEQLSSSRADAERAKLEAAALKARGQILESEMKKFKTHLRSLLTKSETDDRLVEALRGELRSTKGNLEAMAKKAQAAHLHSVPISGGNFAGHGEADEIAQRTIAALKMQISQLRSELDAVGSTPRPILQQQHYTHVQHQEQQPSQQMQSQLPVSRPVHVYSSSTDRF
jgi:hypothetical protein